MEFPGEDIIDRLRRRLCARFFREVDEAGMQFPHQGACIEWVVLQARLFDQGWLKKFFPTPEAIAPDEVLPQVQKPGGRVRGRTLQGWWEQLTPQVLAWGRQQPSAQREDGVDGLLGEAYVRTVELWQHSKGSFALPPKRTNDPVTEWTDCSLTWMTAILRKVATQRTRTREVALAFEPGCGRAERSARDGTMTRLPDRQKMAQRVEYLWGEFPDAVPDLQDRLGGRGTLQLVLVADQLEIALGLEDDRRLEWSLQTLAGRSPKDVADRMRLTENNVRVRFTRIRENAQSRLAALWCNYLPPAPTPEGKIDE